MDSVQGVSNPREELKKLGVLTEEVDIYTGTMDVSYEEPGIT